MIPNWIYESLCIYDLRNPNNCCNKEAGYDEEELEQFGNFHKEECYCDNCFYGRAKLAEYIIQQSLEYEYKILNNLKLNEDLKSFKYNKLQNKITDTYIKILNDKINEKIL